MRKIHVITGGPSTGKTTLCNILEQTYNVTIVPEAARIVKQAGFDPAVDFDGFQNKVATIQYSLEDNITYNGQPAILSDRSVIDGIAYCKVFGRKPTRTLQHHVKRAIEGQIYQNKVFLLDRIINGETDPLRPESEAQRKEIHDAIKHTYQEMGFETVQIKLSKPYQRAAEVYRHLMMPSS